MVCDDLLGLVEALEKLQREHRRKAELKLRFFAGLTINQAAQALGVTTLVAAARSVAGRLAAARPPRLGENLQFFLRNGWGTRA
jgi:hypothetical protein